MTSLGEDQDSHGLFKHVYSIHTYITLHYINTYIHTLHTYIHYIHTYIRTYVHTYIHTHTHTYTHIYMYIHICVYVILCDYMCVSVYLYIVYMGVGQNKGISGSYNRPSTAIPTVSIAGGFCRMRRYFAQRIVKTLLHITVFRDMAWARDYSGGFNNRGAIADQPRTNRGFHRHCLQIKLIWVVRLWTCCSDSSLLLAITIEHSV